MSTKRLSRTPLEAGHYAGGNSRRDGRNHPLRNSVRTKERSFLTKAKYEDVDVHVEEPKENTRNSDKLGAVRRWVLSQCGRPWDKVFSDIREKFDFRTMAGRHILLHIKQYINFQEDHLNFGSRLSVNGKYFVDSCSPAYVNEAGILMRNKNYKRYSRQYRKDQAEREETMQRIKDWADGRSIGSEGALLFWYSCREEDVRVWCEDQTCREQHMHDSKAIRNCEHFAGSRSTFRYHVKRRVRFDRLHKLSPEEQKFFHAIPDNFKPRVANLNSW